MQGELLPEVERRKNRKGITELLELLPSTEKKANLIKPMEINWQKMSRKIFSIDHHVFDNRAIHTIGFDIQSKTSKLQQGVKPYKLKTN